MKYFYHCSIILLLFFLFSESSFAIYYVNDDPDLLKSSNVNIKKLEKAKCTKILSPNMIELTYKNKNQKGKKKVRMLLIGVGISELSQDAPQMKEQIESAVNFLEENIKNKTCYIAYDHYTKDWIGSDFAYVYYKDENDNFCCINAQLLYQGYGYLPPNRKFHFFNEFVIYQTMARAKPAGIWLAFKNSSGKSSSAGFGDDYRRPSKKKSSDETKYVDDVSSDQDVGGDAPEDYVREDAYAESDSMPMKKKSKPSKEKEEDKESSSSSENEDNSSSAEVETASEGETNSTSEEPAKETEAKAEVEPIKDSSVWICTGSNTHEFHNKNNCRVFSNCFDEIKKVSIKKATELKRRPCAVCYPNQSKSKKK